MADTYNNEEKFNDINELYKRVLPALNTKVNELKREKINNVNSKDIWYYCVRNIWNNKKDLRIYDMVNDILNIDTLDIVLFVKRKYKGD